MKPLESQRLNSDPSSRATAEETVLGWLADGARRFPDKVHIHAIDQDKGITYGESYRLACQIARFLAARGVGANHRVALLSNNSLEHLAAYLGTLAYGAAICTIHIDMNAAYLEQILKAVDPKLVLYENGLGVEEMADRTPGEWMPLGSWQSGAGTGWFAELAALSDDPWGPPAGKASDVASIFYTSGTESLPKGVICTFDELYDNVVAVADAFAMRESDRVLDYRSYNWVSAQVLSALAPLCKGATLVMAERFSQSRFFDWVREHGATIAAGNPTIINMLVNRPAPVTAADVPTLRFVTSSSAPLLVQDWKRFEEQYGIPISQGYGCSEAIWIAGSNEHARRMGSVGRPFPYQDLAILDGEGNALPPREIGAIELGRAPDNEYRYLTDDGGIRVNSVGRIMTGDLGYLDEDGFLFVTGREKDLIIRGGVNISPIEIDNTVLELDDVAEAATVGVPDPIYGEEVVVFITPKVGRALTEDAVVAHCRDRLPENKIPKLIYLRESLPKTGRGKMDRKALAEAWRREHADAD
jgi:acyl-CoA synthetase (AMP-forming)/AMP-acid ligase II